MENENTHLNKNTTVDDTNEEKIAFYRNPQIQKLFNEYSYDRDKNKKESQINEKEPNLKPHNQIGAISDKTTKMTTINTLPRIA